MVAGRGRGDGQVGCDGRSTERGGSSTAPPAGEKTEAEKVKSDVALIHGSYRYCMYGVAAPPAFAKHESERYHGAASSSVTSSSSAPPPLPTTLVVKMEDAEPEPPRLPHFAPCDYLDDEQLKLLLLHLGVNAGLTPGDFVVERELDTILGLVARSSQQDADKPAECRHIFVDLVTRSEEPTRRRHGIGLRREGAGGETTKKDHYKSASKEGRKAPGNHPRNLMVRTNDYGRYDPAPAFSKPRFKPIPH